LGNGGRENARRRIESYDEIGERLARGLKSRRTVAVRESRDECADHHIYISEFREDRDEIRKENEEYYENSE